MTEPVELIQDLVASADGFREELTTLRRDFHQHPELSHEEARTAQVVARYLEEAGLQVRRQVAGHGVVGSFAGGRPGKAVAYRADMDALPLTESLEVPWCSRVPGVMHACGHDFHLSIALAAARLLSGARERLAGHFRFIFQPAEEGPPRGEDSGARGMVKAGVLQDPKVEAILALHVAPNLEMGKFWHCSQVAMAGSDHLVLTVQGKPAHGATPHRGVDPIVVSAQVLNQIQAFLAQGVDARAPVVLSFGRISGGNRFNILADQVVLEGSLRYLREAVRDQVLQGLRHQFAGLTQATGAKITLQAQTIYPVLNNDVNLSDKAVGILHRLFGPKRLQEHQPAMGSEDFSFFAHQTPAFYFFLGVRPPGGRGQSLHSPDFNPDEGALPWGLKAAVGLLAALSEPDFPVKTQDSTPW